MPDQISLINLGGGAAVEKFQIELNQVLANIMDVNTDEGKREIVLKVEFKPSRDRDACDIRIHCKSKLAAYSAFDSKAYLGIGRRGVAEIYESNPTQMGLFDNHGVDDDDPKKPSTEKIVEIRKEAIK